MHFDPGFKLADKIEHPSMSIKRITSSLQNDHTGMCYYEKLLKIFVLN